MKVLLDTNVILAAFATRGLCSEILTLCLQRYRIVISEALLKEVSLNLDKKFKVGIQKVKKAVVFLKANSLLYKPKKLLKNPCRDSDDEKILALALESGCQCVVTGDKDLLVLKEFQDIPIISPRTFWERYH